MTFNFVNDEQIKEMLIRDYTELETCLNNRASKSVLILSGSILEAVLIDFFSSKTTDASHINKLYNETLGNLIDRAKNEKLIDDKHKNFSSGIQGYRNLIHPGREVRLKEKFDFDTASLSFSALKLILREIEIKSFAENGRTANEIFNKLSQEGMPDGLFLKITEKLNKTEKKKLFILLVDDEVGNSGPHFVTNASKYALLIIGMVDNLTLQQLSKDFMMEVESGSRRKAIQYLKYIYKRLLDVFSRKDLDIVVELLTDEIHKNIQTTAEIPALINGKIFESFLLSRNDSSSTDDLILLARNLAFYYLENKKTVWYLDIWTIIHGYLSIDDYQSILGKMAKYPGFDTLIADYDNGDYLPF